MDYTKMTLQDLEAKKKELEAKMLIMLYSEDMTKLANEMSAVKKAIEDKKK